MYFKFTTILFGAMTSKLLITAGSNYDETLQIVPVNSAEPLVIDSEIGRILLQVFIKNFAGSKDHYPSSKYNVSSLSDVEAASPTENFSTELPNFRILINFQPSRSIQGSQLVFGNESLTPVKDHVPVSLLSTGLKFFSWWLNPSIKGDVYSETPYLFGLALNSFSRIRIDDKISNETIMPINDDKENLKDKDTRIPESASARKKYYSTETKAAEFTFNQEESYTFQFDTNYIKLGDSQYKLLIPTYGQHSLDIDVGHYANDSLNSFNWVLKQHGIDGAKKGVPGLIIKFALVSA